MELDIMQTKRNIRKYTSDIKDKTLSELIGVSVNTIRSWKSLCNNRLPTLPLFVRLCDACGAMPDEILAVGNSLI